MAHVARICTALAWFFLVIGAALYVAAPIAGEGASQDGEELIKRLVQALFMVLATSALGAFIYATISFLERTTDAAEKTQALLAEQVKKGAPHPDEFDTQDGSG